MKKTLFVASALIAFTPAALAPSALAQEGNSRFTLLFYAYLIALYVFGIRRVNRSSRDDRRVTRETVFDYFRRMQYPLPPQYRDRNDDFWR